MKIPKTICFWDFHYKFHTKLIDFKAIGINFVRLKSNSLQKIQLC